MKTLLLLHGALGCKKQFTALETLLSEKYEVHSFNFSGHGGSTNEKGFSTELFVEDTKQYMEENSIGCCHIFGYSMGGYVALHFAKIYPHKIGKIITLATKFDWTPLSAEKEVKMLDPELIALKVPKFAEMLADRHSPSDWKLVLKKTADMMIGLGNGSALTDDDFKSVSAETIIAVGELDKMVSVESSKKVAHILPNGKLLILENVEHPIEKVDVRTLAGLIANFI